MKKLAKIFFAVSLVAIAAISAFGQQGGPPPGPGVFSNVTSPLVTLTPAVPVPQVTAATASPSVAGSATYFYWIVTDQSGSYSLPSGPFVAVGAPGTLSSSAYDTIQFTPLQGTGITYDILRTATSAAPTGTCNCAVVTGTASAVVEDTSNSLSSYTVTSTQNNCTLQNVISSGSQIVSVTGCGLNSSGSLPSGIFNVTAYGAKCNGSTDDSTAINNAISAASTAGGGQVWFPAATCIANAIITLPSNVYLVGMGRANTILRASPSLAGSSNFVQTANWSICNGNTSNESSCPVEFGIFNMTVDGNMTNRSAGSGFTLAIHGSLYQMSGDYFEKGPGVTVHAEGQGSAITHLAVWTNVKITGSTGGDGFDFSGPADSRFNDFVELTATGIGCLFESTGGGVANGVFLNGIHCFGNTTWGVEINGVPVLGGIIEGESNTGNPGGGVLVTNSGSIMGGTVDVYNNTDEGLEIDSGGGAPIDTVISAVLAYNNGATGVYEDSNASGATIGSIWSEANLTGVVLEGTQLNVGSIISDSNTDQGLDMYCSNCRVGNAQLFSNGGTGLDFSSASAVNNSSINFTSQSNNGGSAGQVDFGTTTFTNTSIHGSLFTGSGTEYSGTPPASIKTDMQISYTGASSGILYSGVISSGTVTLSSGAGSHTFTTAYTNTPICTAVDQTNADAVKVTATTSTITFAGNASDVIAWTCTPGAQN
jgi:hypothetical protein